MRKLMAILAVLGLAFTSLLGATANATDGDALTKGYDGTFVGGY